MELKLIYEGRLKSNARPNEKHELRVVFHDQLLNAWNYLPLVGEYADWIKIPPVPQGSF